MSSRLPADVTYSLTEFARHGGRTGPHRDGWGIAYSEEGDVRLIKDIDAASDSPSVRFVAGRGFRSRTVVSHIRMATQGEVALRNTQPFVRELGGRFHVFAHNGDLSTIRRSHELGLGFHRPVGETDSELAFCALLHLLEPLWLSSHQPPDLDRRLEIVVGYSRLLRELGPANFGYFDGDSLFLHGHRRKHGGSEEPRPPGLHVLCRTCAGEGPSLSSPGLTISPGAQTVVLGASIPLTSERWQPLEEGEIVVARDGAIVESVRPGQQDD